MYQHRGALLARAEKNIELSEAQGLGQCFSNFSDHDPHEEIYFIKHTVHILIRGKFYKYSLPLQVRHILVFSTPLYSIKNKIVGCDRQNRFHNLL